MNYEQLKSSIRAVIKENGNEEITGNLLQDALIAIVSALGEGYAFKGLATSLTVPGIPDGNVFYVALQPGHYSHFDVEVKPGECAILYNTGDDLWSKVVISTAEPVIIPVTWVQEPEYGMPHFESEEYGVSVIASLVALGRRVFLRGASSYHGSQVLLPVNWCANLGADGYMINYNWWDESGDRVATDTLRT